ncbi:MAG: hypothetical protein NPINA01_12440 [Nitrospinaceae bacterium]|nr:MAG: hypothetical protein NPINA01_12440 [Nitrospinaceae bacterium]
MSLFDSLTVIVLTLSLIYSMVRGMVREIFSLLAYVGGYFLALNFRGDLSSTLRQYISNPTAVEILSFGLIFIAGVVGISFLGKGIQKLVHSAPGLSGLDRVFGGVLGLAKGVIILIILMFPLKFFPNLNGDITRDSYFAPHLKNITQVLGQGLSGNRFIEKFPSIDLSGVKENFVNLKDFDKLTQGLKSKDSDPPDELQGEPQDKYTKEDEKKLQDILISLDKK